VTLSKTTELNRPQTRCRVTALGRRRYIEYLAVLEQVILDGAAVNKVGSAARRLPKPAGA
jgi:hypothetical protein